MGRSFQPSFITYEETGKFTKIIVDYLKGSAGLKDFYTFEVNDYGIESVIEAEKKYPTNRKLLADQLQQQYQGIEDCDAVKANIDALLRENTFTVCTAHQPNIFTGHLYFIYKVLHTIKLAEVLKGRYPAYNFVPVYFMGSEDHDLDELNHVFIDGRKYTWHTKQKGSIGKMKVDDLLLRLIDEIASRLLVEEHGSEIVDVLRKCFQKNSTIAQSTFLFVHHLFKEYGLIVLLPDNNVLKNEMKDIFEQDVFENIPFKIVSKTTDALSGQYKVQVNPREINLFYLGKDIRNRLIKKQDRYFVDDTQISFSADELKKEIQDNPGHFSPNVIIRCLYQERILPNIAFIGGGGELAYWLEMKNLFEHYKIPFPVLVLRNSFLLIEKKVDQVLQKLGIPAKDLFQSEHSLLNEIIKKHTPLRLDLEEEKFQLRQIYNAVEALAGKTDVTLRQHVEALEAKTLKRMDELEKKMIRAEKRKFADLKNQLSKVYSTLFPGGNLQERTENFMLFYAGWGNDFLDVIYKNSLSLEQQFCIIEERD
ncbi:MAG TPA: bacillithiol biosynthesis cysteine-adding enzyme BshC [Chitinophagaceae bacterium]|nr:bacillithiol biosynthesis cysteine-adding enzyme BshC [Chitinophagaceae bacterium]